jgi:hypothetical protein
MKLAPGEKIIRRYYQTRLVLVFYFCLCILLAYIPLNFVKSYELGETLGSIPNFWLLIVALYFLNHVLLWKLNYTLLTDQRLLIIKYHNLLHSQITDLPKDKIVNIAYEKKGIFSTILDFGNVIIQQQSLAQPVILGRLPEPDAVKDEINATVRQ